MSDPSQVTILVAHGSRNPDAAAAHELLCRAVAERTAVRSGRRHDVRPAYLELAEPSIPQAIDAAVEGGAGSVRVLPHFLGPGNHVQRDIPAIVEAARDRHRPVSIELAPHLGADPRLVDLIVDLVDETSCA